MLYLFYIVLAASQCLALLRQVAYISTTSSADGMDQLDIKEILLKCRKYNSDNQITGVLVYHDVNVFQIIEGDTLMIDKVFVRIHNDVRHRGIIIIHDKIVEERAFPRWSMMFRDLKYTEKMEEWAVQTEKSIFDDIIQIGGLDVPGSANLASHKAMKLLEVYSRLLFHHPRPY